MKRGLIIVALATWALFMLADPTWALRKSRREVEELIRGHDRYVDLAVEIRVVRQDEAGEALTGNPAVKLAVLNRHFRGARYDTLNRKWAGPPQSRVVWFVSEEQEGIVLHDTDMPQSVWMQGSMGAGKTTAGCIWVALRVIEHATHGLEGAGITGPTLPRLEPIRTAMFGPKDRSGLRIGGMWPREWATFREGDQVATCCTGLQIDFKSTQIQSAAVGSQLQGQNWGFCLSDELQDYYEENGNIVMRLRNGWNGRPQRFVTVTPKDDPGYRTFRDSIEELSAAASPLWVVQRVLGENSPFLPASHWINAKAGMGVREYQRKVLALDVAAEGVVYNSWDRALNLAELPTASIPRWKDVTSRELSRWGSNFDILVGYDPGRLFDVSILLKAFQPPTPSPTRQVPQPRAPYPVWFVIGEVTTERSTTAHHCLALQKTLRDKYGCNMTGDGPQAFVRADPATTTGTDENSPDMSVYTVFRQYGFEIKAAAYSSGIKHGRVPKEGRIDMVNTLLCNVDGERRLRVACDARRKPAAPKLVEALERMERDGDSRAERDRKDKHDLSHWACALGYALWSVEKPRLDSRAE